MCLYAEGIILISHWGINARVFYLSPTSCWELEFDLRLIKPCGKSHVAHSFSMAQASQHTKNKQEKHSLGDTLC